MMGIFASIKNAIRGSDKDDAASPARAAPPPPAPASAAPASPAAQPAPPAAATAPDPISQSAMEERIGRMPGAESHNWRSSIVDLMKMVGVDPSFENRKELADELGLDDYTGTAEQNIALHHAVLNMLAVGGGDLPDSLRD